VFIHVQVSLSHSWTGYTTDPQVTGFKSCLCTTVMYSLTSACEGCMSDDWPTYASSTGTHPSRSSLMDLPSDGFHTPPGAPLSLLFHGEINVFEIVLLELTGTGSLILSLAKLVYLSGPSTTSQFVAKLSFPARTKSTC
jgi:hypothetical protein